jgi:hypothetical protein
MSALVMFLLRRFNFKRLPLNRRLLQKMGIWPIRDHYYEPIFRTEHLRSELKKPRELPGIDFNESEQLSLLKELSRFADETLSPIPHYNYQNDRNIKIGFYKKFQASNRYSAHLCYTII